MTDETKTPAPERMGDDTFEALAENAVTLAARHGVRIAAEMLVAEARRARAEVERLTRERDGLKESETRLANENRALSEENLRLHMGECLSVSMADETVCRLLRPKQPETWCVACVRADQHIAIVAERDAAQKEAERLREYVEDAAKLECLCGPTGGCGCSVAVRDSAKETLEEVDHAK